MSDFLLYVVGSATGGALVATLFMVFVVRKADHE